MLKSDHQKELVAQKSFQYLLNKISSTMGSPRRKIILGIGSGSTIKFFISILGNSYKTHKIKFDFLTISSSTDSEIYCRELGLPIGHLSDLPFGTKIDYYIDGADEVDSQKRCLKGLGGASTREKLLRIESNEFIVLVDESKKVQTLCSKHPIVLEILPFGFEKTLERIKSISPSPTQVIVRRGTGKMGFVITDNNNYLVDVFFTNLFNTNTDFADFDRILKSLSGVVETGLFAKPADMVFIAKDDDVEILS